MNKDHKVTAFISGSEEQVGCLMDLGAALSSASSYKIKFPDRKVYVRDLSGRFIKEF